MSRARWCVLLVSAACASAQAQQAATDASATPPPSKEAAASGEGGDLKTIPVQELPAQPTPAAAATETQKNVVLDEIQVTATKRSKSARKIPVSIDAFKADELNQRGAQGAQDALLFSPGVSVNSYLTPNTATIQVRGTTADSISSIGGPPTGIFFDDLSLTSPTLIGSNPNIDAFDLDTVEVLKGPQGTLFGGSALAGALRSVPKKPRLEKVEAQAFYAPTKVNESEGRGHDYGAMLNVPLGERFALRGMATRRSYPGAIDNTRDGLRDTDSFESQQWRGMLRWEPLEKLSVQAVWHDIKGSLNDLAYTDNPDTLEHSNESGLSPNSNHYRIGQLKTDYRFEPVSIGASIARVRKDDMFVANADRAVAGQNDATDTLSNQRYTADIRSAELRLSSNARSKSDWLLLRDWDYLLGVFVYRADQTGLLQVVSQPRSQTVLPGTTLPTLPVDPLPTSSLATELLRAQGVAIARENAIYFDTTRYLDFGAKGDDLELNFGGRLFKQKSTGNSVSSVAGQPASTSGGVQEESGFNPKVAVTYYVLPRVSLRAVAVKGFRFGGNNTVVDMDPDVPPTYTSDELWNYEFGVRTEWFKRRLRFDMTGYYIDWSRVQITQRTFSGLSLYIDNVGKAVSQGVEAQTRVKLPAGFVFSLGGAYTDARTTVDFQGKEGNVPAGRRLPGTPYLTGSAVLGFARAIGPAQFDAGLTWNYQGKAFNSLNQDAIIPAYQIFGASLNLGLPDFAGAPTIGVNVSNLFDKRTYNNAAPPINGSTDYFPIRPRMLSLRVGASFK